MLADAVHLIHAVYVVHLLDQVPLSGVPLPCVRTAACSESVAALKRLLREVFAEQLTIKQRLTDAEKAASAAGELEAADDYRLRLALAGGSSWVRAPVRMSGHVVAAGLLPWSQVGTALRTQLEDLNGHACQ
jgi:hypothetical protein